MADIIPLPANLRTCKILRFLHNANVCCVYFQSRPGGDFELARLDELPGRIAMLRASADAFNLRMEEGQWLITVDPKKNGTRLANI